MTLYQRLTTIFSYIFLLLIVSLGACVPFTIETTPLMIYVVMPSLLIVLLSTILVIEQIVIRNKIKAVKNSKITKTDKSSCILLFGLCRHFR